MYLQNQQIVAAYRIDDLGGKDKSLFTQVAENLDHLSGSSIGCLWLKSIFPRSGNSSASWVSYPIVDFQAIDPSLGTKSDFYHFLQAAHRKHLLVVLNLDITPISQQSEVYTRHPEWFVSAAGFNQETNISSAVFKFPNPHLQSYLIEILLGWAALGLDGYSLPADPVIPAWFWNEAKEAVKAIKPPFLWLTQDQLKLIEM